MEVIAAGVIIAGAALILQPWSTGASLMGCAVFAVGIGMLGD